MKGTLRALVFLLIVVTLMVPAIGLTIDEQSDDEGEVDDTTEDLEPIFEPLTVVIGALILLVGVGTLFSWLGVFG